MNNRYSSERTSEEYLVLNSCGMEEFYEIDGNCNRPSGRADYHILYVKAGFCHLTADGKTEKYPEGTVILFRPGQPQRYTFKAAEKSVSCYIHFTGVGCRNLLDKIGFPDSHTVYIGRSRVFEEAFEKMLREYNIRQSKFEMCCSGLLAELLAEIGRSIETPDRRSPRKAIVEKACIYIFDNLKTVTINELAGECYLSVGRFAHIFKEVTGKAPGEYIRDMRLQKAGDMLINTDFPIGKIAEETGYADRNYFSRLFRKKFGVTPGEYRK